MVYWQWSIDDGPLANVDLSIGNRSQIAFGRVLNSIVVGILFGSLLLLDHKVSLTVSLTVSHTVPLRQSPVKILNSLIKNVELYRWASIEESGVAQRFTAHWPALNDLNDQIALLKLNRVRTNWYENCELSNAQQAHRTDLITSYES